MAMKWNSETTVRFIKEYKAFECLWDTNSITYLNGEMRANAYKTIAANMNIPGFDVPEVKNKIRNLRSTYFQEQKKILKSKARNEQPVYVPTLKWLSEMEPILRGVEPRKTTLKSLNGSFAEANGSPSVSDDERRPAKRKNDTYTENLDKIINQLLNEPMDEDQIFGQYVASELRQLKQESCKRKLKRIINEAIASIADEDESEMEAS